MLDRQDLPAVAQRALRQQANLGEAVEHHAGWPDAFDHFKNLFGGLAQFQVRGIQQRLLVLGRQQAFGGRQFEDMDIVVQLPAMGARTLAQFAFGFRQGDVQRAFAGFGAGQQKVQGDRGLAGTGFSLKQKHVAAGQSAIEDVIETINPCGGFYADQLVGCRQKMPSHD
ncbi:hypothetical protein D3C73_1120330 [compost metagenome]